MKPVGPREVVICPPALRPHARRALAGALEELRREATSCQHRAREIEEPALAELLDAIFPVIGEAVVRLNGGAR